MSAADIHEDENAVEKKPNKLIIVIYVIVILASAYVMDNIVSSLEFIEKLK